MDAKEYLESYKLIQTRINVLRAEIERLRAEAESVGINLDGMPKGQGSNDKLAQLAVQIADCESVLLEELSGLFTRKIRIISQLGKLKEHKHQLLLQKRYLECKSWETVAYEMDITSRYCFMLHESALAEFANIIQGGMNE